MNKLKQLAGNTLIYGISTILVRSLNWLISPFYSVVFNNVAQNVGVITVVYAYIAFINVLLMYGMETAFFRFSAKAKNSSEVFKTTFTSLLISTSIFCTIAFLFADQIASLISYPNRGNIIRLVCIILGVDTLSNIPFAQLRLEGKSIQYVAIKLFNVVVNISLNIFLLYPMYIKEKEGIAINANLGLFYVFLANMIASTSTFIIFLPSIIRSKLGINFTLLKKMLFYGGPLIIAGLAGIANETLDRILLKILLPYSAKEVDIQIGIYSMAYKLSIFMALVVQAYRLGAEPFFFKQAGDKDEKETLAKAMNIFTLAAITIFLAVSLNIDWIVLILGSNFREGKEIVPIILMAYLFLGIFYNLSVWYKVTDKTRAAMIISLIGAILTILINVIFIPTYGYWASAWATFASFFTMTVTSWLWGKKYYPVPYNIKLIVSYILSAILIYIFFKQMSFSNYSMQVVFGNLIVISASIYTYKKMLKLIK